MQTLKTCTGAISAQLHRHGRWLLPLIGLLLCFVAPVLLGLSLLFLAIWASIRSWKRHRWLILIAWMSGLASLYPLACGIVFLTQDRLILHPDRRHPVPPADLPILPTTLTTADGERLAAWFLPQAEPKAVVLYCHGNSGHLAHCVTTLRLLHELGCTVMAFDYRGFGDSSGRPSEAGLYADAETALTWLTTRTGVQAQEVICYGESLGGGVAARTAQRFACRGLVLSSTYASLMELATEKVPFLPVRRLLRYELDSRARLHDYPGRILLLHGRQDQVIPAHHSLLLAAIHPDRTRLVLLEAGHDDLIHRHRQEVRAALTGFLDAVALGPSPGPAPHSGPNR